jgi:PAS domain S-box-containing protein
MRATIEGVFKSGRPGYYEVQTADDSRWYGCRVAPIFRNQRVDTVAAICTDITERKLQEELLRQSEERLRLMAEQAPVILWTADKEMRITMSMGAGLAALGLTQNKTNGRTLAEYFQSPDFPALANIQRAIEGEHSHFEQEWAGHVYANYVEPLRDAKGTLVGAIGVALDVSERKAAERALRQANDLLEQRVAERTKELQCANESLLSERRVLKRLLELHDRDRQLIAYEIHDGLVQDMAGAVMRLEAAHSAWPADCEPSGKKHLASAIRLMQGGIAEARRLINGLRPPVLEAEGVESALANLAEEHRLNGDLDVDLTCDVQFRRIPPALETAIYRIVQEGLSNVRNHSQSKKARVKLAQKGDRVTIEIQDNGVGFDPAAKKGRRHGLEGIRERARLLDGKFEIDSKPGQGTTLTIELPLTEIEK